MTLRSFFALPALTLCLSLGAAACGSSDEGSAPTIKDFTMTPATLETGKSQQVIGTFTVEDPDGDIAGGSGDITFPNGQVLPLSDVTLAGGDATSIPVRLTIPTLTATDPGAYVVAIQARDRAGNQSARTSFTLTAP
ncbi:MAG: hypothetical protein JWP97_229 [Labilithrix sp.]|nr:hypothetical protein [Labilithrix sp.]